MPEVQVHAMEGRAKDQKRLIKGITDAVVRTLDVTAEWCWWRSSKARPTMRQRAACYSTNAQQHQWALQQPRRLPARRLPDPRGLPCTVATVANVA
jgi:hypothetical protein